MNDDPVAKAKLLASIVILLAYEAGEYPAEDYDAVDRARATIREYLPTAIVALGQ